LTIRPSSSLGSRIHSGHPTEQSS
jgi:hypothetical protein